MLIQQILFCHYYYSHYNNKASRRFLLYILQLHYAPETDVSNSLAAAGHQFTVFPHSFLLPFSQQIQQQQQQLWRLNCLTATSYSTLLTLCFQLFGLLKSANETLGTKQPAVCALSNKSYTNIRTIK